MSDVTTDGSVHKSAKGAGKARSGQLPGLAADGLIGDRLYLAIFDGTSTSAGKRGSASGVPATAFASGSTPAQIGNS